MSIINFKGEDRIKVIIKYPKSDIYPKEDKKFALSFHMTAQELLILIRRRLNLKSTNTIVLMCGYYMITGNMMIGEIYKRHGDQDNPLVIRCVEENVFG